MPDLRGAMPAAVATLRACVAGATEREATRKVQDARIFAFFWLV